ncbi:DUF4265 domain-containing protein [Anaeromyxobacter paludicola]|uniref:DUF4265 domain-containing protein n=1 Tax=Anaeromyxobacter paludicola TaxID=2918171 RepID=A0ABM7X5P3_9BACT|nr:DUF4265 domain-containing protein [Anaeromyxobacter paludicola]BDG07131.1 hypothetical protein AMPC_02440 [Anaeromyxobacter paludicola]
MEVRIAAPVEGGAGEGDPETEWIEAEALGSDRYRLLRPPFLAYGLSRDDVVHAESPGGDLPIRIEEVERKSGHRTIRAALDPGVALGGEELAPHLERLRALGCELAALPPSILAVDAPEEVDLGAVVERLSEAARENLLVFEWVDPRRS